MDEKIQGLDDALGEIDESITSDSNEIQSSQDEHVEEVVSSKIKVGDSEYSQEELDRLVRLGRIGVEAEEKYNTKIDRVYSEYTKSRQEIKELKEIADEYEKVRTSRPENEEQAIREAKDAARKLGLVLDEDFDKALDKRFDTYYEQRRAAERFLEKGSNLEKEIDGSDGRPPFRTQDVLEYMRDEMGGQGSMETAYKLMNEKALDAWKEAQIGKVRKPGMNTTISGSGGDKRPPEIKPTKSNIDKLVEEALGL